MHFSEEYTYVVDLLNKVRMAAYNAHKKPNTPQKEFDDLERKERILTNICGIISDHDSLVIDH